MVKEITERAWIRTSLAPEGWAKYRDSIVTPDWLAILFDSSQIISASSSGEISRSN
jgi:hypothetical protein